MGAWNYGVFDDDTAYDALDDLKASQEIITDMEKYFDAVIGVEYVDYDGGHYALVSAAAIDAVLSDSSELKELWWENKELCYCCSNSKS